MNAAAPIPYAFLDPHSAFPSKLGEGTAACAVPHWLPQLHIHHLGWREEAEAIVLPVGAITDHGWLSDCLQYLPRRWPEAPWMRQLAGYRVERDGAAVQLLEANTNPTQRLVGRWCVLNDLVAHRNLAHFFADLLPQLVAIRRLRQRWADLQVLGLPERYPNLRLLRELLLEGGWQPRPPGGMARAPRLAVDTLLLQPLAFNGGVGFLKRPGKEWWLAIEELQEGIQLLRSALRPDPGAAWRGHWLCFSRDLAAPTEMPQGRWFSNYPQLLEQLSNAGVVVVDPGRYDIRQLQLLVAEARGFVGIHGAGLINGLLGPPGARLVEILPACGCWRMLELLGVSVGMDWQVVRCSADPVQPERSVIPIEAVLALLDAPP